MKKFFGALFVVMMIFSANVYAAKPEPEPVLADIDAKNFFANFGYDVDCSYWYEIDGKQLFSVIFFDEPLMLSRFDPNMEIYAEAPKVKGKLLGNVSEVVAYLKANADKKISAALIARIFTALDENFSKANGDAINQDLSDFMNGEATEKIIANKYVLSREEPNAKTLVVHIKPVPIPDTKN